VVFAMVLAVLFLGESISIRHCLGAACIVAGSLILVR
jgi:drug/metabolite transporter (DMT)-like permease